MPFPRAWRRTASPGNGGARPAYFTGRRLGALYRDSIELDMVTVLSSLRYQCRLRNGEKIYDESVYRTSAQFYGDVRSGANPCAAYDVGIALWQRGSGDLSLWVDFLYTNAAQFRTSIIPDQNSFVQASDLIWRACEQIADSSELVAECIGRRNQQEECGCYKDECPSLTYGKSAYSIDFKPAVKPKTVEDSKPRGDEGSFRNCPLIAFYETMEARQNRYSKASARLDWLSLTHYPGNNAGVW